MIKEKTIIKSSLIIFILTFTLLTYIDATTTPKHTNISQITLKYLNNHITTQGIIQKQTLNKNNLYLTIKDINSSTTINAIIFKTNQTLQKNKKYTFEGKITLYNQMPEIIINKIY